MIKTHVCEYCENVYPIAPNNGSGIKRSYNGTVQNTISYRPDPFNEEIRGDFTDHWLCDDCYYNSRMEI